MTIDFGWTKTPKMRVASITWKGPWKESTIRAQFEKVERWVKSQGLRPGRWVFQEPGTRRWEAAIEIKGPAKGAGPVRIKTLQAVTAAHVVFDPDVVSPRVVYHGLSDWLRWRRKEHEIRSVRSTREVYLGNPWRDAKAWSRTEVQFLVRK